MTNPSAFSTPKVFNDQLMPTEINAIDDGQVNALTRTGTTPLTGDTTIQGGGHILTINVGDNAASGLAFTMGTTDVIVTQGGAGIWSFSDIAKVRMNGSGYPIIGSRTEGRIQRGAALEHVTFGFDNTTKVNLSSAALGHVNFELTNLIDGGVMTTVTLNAQGNYGASFVNLPASMPFLQVYKLSSLGILTSLGSVTDASANVGAFNAGHSIALTGLSETISPATARYFAYVFAPGGANYVANTYGVTSVVVSQTVTSLRPGG